LLPVVSTGYCQGALVNESGMIRTSMGKANRSEMVAMHGTSCAIPPPNSNSNGSIYVYRFFNVVTQHLARGLGMLISFGFQNKHFFLFYVFNQLFDIDAHRGRVGLLQLNSDYNKTPSVNNTSYYVYNGCGVYKCK
jgi:hypothetical protein